jgi:hypothetical protein
MSATRFIATILAVGSSSPRRVAERLPPCVFRALGKKAQRCSGQQTARVERPPVWPVLGFSFEDGLILQAIIAWVAAHQRMALQSWRILLTFSQL